MKTNHSSLARAVHGTLIDVASQKDPESPSPPLGGDDSDDAGGRVVGGENSWAVLTPFSIGMGWANVLPGNDSTV